MNSLQNSYKTTKTKNSLTGLRYLVNYHGICSVSYLDTRINDNKSKLNLLIKITFILWNLAFLSYSSYYCYTEFMDIMEVLDVKHFDSSKSKVIFVVFISGSISYNIQAFILNIIIMINGNKILNLMRNQALDYIDYRTEKKIGFIIALAQFLICFFIELFISFIFYGFPIRSYSFDLKNFFKSTFIYYLIFNSQSIIISLIAYQSHIVSKKFSTISKDFLHSKQNIHQIVCKINGFINKLDELTSLSILIIISLNTTICISYLCMFAINPKKFSIISIASILESLTLLISTCLTCNIIPKNFKKFCDKFEESICESTFTNQLDYLYQYSLVTKINAIKQDIGFTAFNLFKVNTNTIISCLALILSYSVILIQTSYE